MDRLTAMHSFSLVAKLGSFTQAAERLGLSRLQVTRHVQELETWLSQRLLHRTTRKVTLTDAGEQALNHFQEILHQAGMLGQLAQQQAQQLRGTLRVAAPIGLAQQWLVAPVRQFCQRHPAVTIELIVADSNADLVQQRVDIALRFATSPDPQLIARRLMTIDSVICAAPSYLLSAPALEKPNDLAQHPCLVHLHQQQWAFVDRQQVTSVVVSGPVRANDLQTLVHLAVQGLGVVRLPCDLANPLLVSNQLRRVLADWPLPQHSLWAVYLSRQYQSPLVRQFIDFIAEHHAADITPP